MTTRPIPLSIGRNASTLEYESDMAERGTEIDAKCAQLAGKDTFLGNARFQVASSNSGAKTFTPVDPTGGSGAVGFDDQLIGFSVLREKTNELVEITDTVKGPPNVITLASWPSGMADGEYVQLRDEDGLIPIKLSHPVYIADTYPGIGPKGLTIDRSDITAVSNLLPNPVFRTWSDTAKMPDGWRIATFQFSNLWTAHFDTPPAGLSVTQETDPLYTRIGGASLHFDVPGAILISPPIAWTPQYPGQRFSVRSSLLLTGWSSFPNSYLKMHWGIKLSDGTIVPWTDPDLMLQAEPTKIRPAPWVQIAGGTWIDLELPGFDITAPSTYTPNLRPNQSDIDGLDTADGLVVVFWLFGNGANNVEGYLDGVTVVPADRAPPSVTEFGDANAVYQDVQTALTRLAPPQYTFSAQVLDLKRLDPSIDEEELDRGNFVAITSSDFGIVNDVQRITDARINDLVEGDTVITVEPRLKRFTRRLISGTKQAEQTVSTVSGGTTTPPSGGTTGGNPSGGTNTGPGISLSYTLAGNVPTVTATVSGNVVKVYWASSFSGVPSSATVLAGTVDATAPYSFVGPSIPSGDTLTIAAIAEDNNGIRSVVVSIPITISLTASWLRVEPGVGYWQDTAETTVAADGDIAKAWEDQSGNGRDLLLHGGYGDSQTPLVQQSGKAIRFGDPSRAGGRGSYIVPVGGLTEGEIIIVLQRESAPAGGGAPDYSLMQLGGLTNGTERFPDTDGHWWSTFGTDHNTGGEGGYDCGLLPDGVINGTDGFHWIRMQSSASAWRAWLDGVLVKEVLSGLAPSFSIVNGLLGENTTGSHFNGWIAAVEIIDGIRSDAEAEAVAESFLTQISGSTSSEDDNPDDSPALWTPTTILRTETFTVPANKQVLFKKPIRVRGSLRVRGDLVQTR